MGKYKKLTPIEIFLILAIIAVLAIWLFPRFLNLLKSHSTTIGIFRPYVEQASGIISQLPNKLLSFTYL
jgi:hypothetical protein